MTLSEEELEAHRLAVAIAQATGESLTLDYGKGRHPAGLNIGDCFAYALAKWLDQPLLFKVQDFARTDVRVA